MSNTQTQGAELAPIQIAAGVYARVNKVVVDCDLVDGSGTPLEAGGFTQSPNSIITLAGSDLAGTELNVQAVANKIYGLEAANE